MKHFDNDSAGMRGAMAIVREHQRRLSLDREEEEEESAVLFNIGGSPVAAPADAPPSLSPLMASAQVL